MSTGFWAAGAGSVVAAAAWAVPVAASGARQMALPAALRSLAADAFLLEAAAVTVLAPIAGAALADRRRMLAASVGGFVGISLLAALAASRAAGVPPGFALRGHIGLAIVTAALATLGALAASRLSNRLDAAALALTVSVVASLALLAGGPATAELCETAINAGLLASPPVAITSAAGIDLLRTDVLYQLAPVAHRRFAYPTWQMTAAAYGALAVACVALTPRGSRP